MAYKIRKVDYFYASVDDQPGEAYKLLSLLAEIGVNLLAFTAVPCGPMRTQLTLFPEDTHKLEATAKQAKLNLNGPRPALLVQGDDELGAMAEIHAKLFDARVNIYASSGVTDGQGSYGYVIYVRPDEYEKAADALEI
ncbi:hypothetical protein ACFLU6_06870 [Acidobacteriota bacterium]